MAALGPQAPVLMGQQTMVLLGPQAQVLKGSGPTMGVAPLVTLQVVLEQQVLRMVARALPVVVALRQAEPVPLAPPMVQARMMVLAQRAPPQVMRQPAWERWVALERE